MDPATAETLSRQNSVDTETVTCTDHKEVSELSTYSEENKITCSETNVASENHSADLANRCTLTLSSWNGASAADPEDIRIIVHEVLNSLINQIAEYEHSPVHEQNTKSFKDSKGMPVLLRDNVTVRDLHSISPTSEDSGIGCPLSHAEESKPEDAELDDHAGRRHDHLMNDSAMTQESSGKARVEDDESASSDHSFLSTLSSNVKYWLGQRSYDKTGKCYVTFGKRSIVLRTTTLSYFGRYM